MIFRKNFSTIYIVIIMKKIKRRIKWKNVFLLLFILICIIILKNSIDNMILWKLNSSRTENQIKEIHEIVEIKEKENTEKMEIIENKEIIEKSNPYWDYIKMSLIDVNFTNLKEINPSTKGWIQINGTNVNYPFVQTTNNDYYLTHSFDKSYNSAGWIFLDYRNNLETDRNTIIYGHSMNDKTMFGSLKTILSNGWLENINNYIIKLSTETENTLWQIFSVYHIPTTTDYLKTSFNSNQSFLTFANMILERSEHNFNTSINETDKILTLSTCYNKTDKLAIHAKLIKREIKAN